jgi:hypothetical protein
MVLPWRVGGWEGRGAGWCVCERETEEGEAGGKASLLSIGKGSVCVRLGLFHVCLGLFHVCLGLFSFGK